MNKNTIHDGLWFICIVIIFVVYMSCYKNEYLKIDDYNTLISNIKSYISQLDYVNILLVNDKIDTLKDDYLDVFGVKNDKTMKKLRVYFDENMKIEGHVFVDGEMVNEDDSLYTYTDLNTKMF